MRPADDPADRLASACANAVAAIDDVVGSRLSYPAWIPTLVLCRSRAARVSRELHRERAGPGRIVVIGRTKAGKSTLRYVLTGDGKEGIGRGGQRTTRKLIEYRWRDLDVVDTPGVGGFHTDEDTEVALAAAEDADLILWVTTSDGVQLETERPVLQAALGRPMLVLVNHKSTFSADEVEAGIDADIVLADRDGLDARICARLAKAGLPETQIVHVHLGLARRARYEFGDQGLANQVGIVGAEDAVVLAAARAVDGRGETASNRVRVETNEMIRLLHESTSLVELHRKHLRVEHAALLDAVRRSEEEFARAFIGALDALRDQAVAHVDAAVAAARIQPHRGHADGALRERMIELAEQTAVASVVAWNDAHETARGELPTVFRHEHGDLSDGPTARLVLDPAPLAGDPQIGVAVQRVLKIGTGALGVIAFVATDGLASLIAPPAASLIGDRVRRATKSFVPNREAEQERRDASVEINRAALTSAVTEWHAAALGEVAEASSVMAGDVVSHAELIRERIERYAEWVAELRRRARDLSAALDTLQLGR